MINSTRRQFLQTGMAGGITLATAAQPVWSANANNEITLGFIGCGGRGNILMSAFSKLSGVTIGGVCDPDAERLAQAKERFPKAHAWTDLRDLIQDESIDAVVIATCNHWHCLAAIWAMEAGKDVYVEKPLSHSQWEGEQTVAAAAKYKKICQLGTQQRSDPMQAEIKEFLHDRKELGDIESVLVNRIGVRSSMASVQHLCPYHTIWTTIFGSVRRSMNQSFETSCSTTGTGIGIQDPARWATGASTSSTMFAT